MHDLDQDLRNVVVRAISALASVCDHAQTIDRQGFSKATAGPGHEIAAIGSDRWTPKFWDYAARLSSHHSRQLEKIGQLDGLDGERLREAVRGPSVRAPDIPTRWIEVADVDGKRMVVLSIPSGGQLPKVLKNLPEGEVYRPAGVGRLWRVSEKWAFAIQPFIGEFAKVGDGVEEAVDASFRKSTAADRALATDLPVVRFDAEKDEFFFAFEYDAALVIEVKRHGGRFEKGWSWKQCAAFIPADRIGAAIVDSLVTGAKAVLDGEAESKLEEARATEPSPASLAAVAPPRLVFGEVSDGKLRVTMTRFDNGFVGVVRAVPGRIYDGGSWLIPASSEAVGFLAAKLDELATPEAVDAAAELRGIASGFPVAGTPMATEMMIDGTGTFVTVEMTRFVPEWVNAIRCLPHESRHYNAGSKTWKVRKDDDTFSMLLKNLQSSCARAGNPAYLAAAVEKVAQFLGSIRDDDDNAFSSGPRM